jgi:phage terminase large subunit-like protein
VGLNRQEKIELLSLLNEKERRYSRTKIYRMYPETGPLRRELYKPHCAFFEAGAKYRERGIISANRIGKTEGVGGHELTLHLTGRYPFWWKGRRFGKPISAWAAGDTSQTVRDIIQAKLLGEPGNFGTGLIPGDLLLGTKNKAGSVPDAVESIDVRHVSGGVSRLGLKSYDQKRKSFQGTEKDVIWLDEECDLGIYAECLLRTMTTDGLIMCTFTPLLGLSETVLSFMPGGKIPESFEKTGKFVVNATWDDAPHLTESQKQELLSSIPAYQRDARSKGIPQLGSGAIYPLSEEEITIEPFDIPPTWPKVYALDVGWNRTAVLWGAWDQQSDVVYLYSEYYRGQAEPVIHAEAIKARGEWIPGVIDPAARGRSQKDGTRLVDDYIALKLHLSYAENAVEAGLLNVWQRLSTGRLKVFKGLQNFLAEYRIYRRDEKGNIVKEHDHLMDDCRYLCMSGLAVAMTAPPEAWEIWDANHHHQTDAVDSVTGY